VVASDAAAERSPIATSRSAAAFARRCRLSRQRWRTTIAMSATRCHEVAHRCSRHRARRRDGLAASVSAWQRRKPIAVASPGAIAHRAVALGGGFRPEMPTFAPALAQDDRDVRDALSRK